MKHILLSMLLLTATPVFASGTITTGKIDKWGHTQDSLVLIMHKWEASLNHP